MATPLIAQKQWKVVLSAKKSARKAKMIRSHPSNISEKRKFA
jgi:hypothetical protein